MKTIIYTLHQDVQTATGTHRIQVIPEMQCLDTDDHGIANFEARLAPRIREYEKCGKITVMRQTREEVSL